MKFRGRLLFNLTDKVIDPILGCDGKGLIVLRPLHMDERFLLLLLVKLGALELLQIVTIRQITELRGDLPVIRQKLPVLKLEPSSLFARGLQILATVGSPRRSSP